MTGPAQRKVTKSSAERIGSSIRHSCHAASDTDNRGLVKFPHQQDGRYQSMIGQLERLTKVAASRTGTLAHLDGPRALQSYQTCRLTSALKLAGSLCIQSALQAVVAPQMLTNHRDTPVFDSRGTGS